MTDDTQRLVLEMGVNLQRFERDMAKILGVNNAQTKKLINQFERANGRISRSTESMSRDVRQYIAGIGLVYLGREVLRYGDTWTDLENKVKAAGKIAGQEARNLYQLQDAAIDARSSTEPYIDLYARLLRSGEKVAATEEDIARATHLVAKAFRAGGASAQEQAAGIIQLGQAIGSGFLQGDELRSVRENAPIVADAIADAMGVTIGELKKLGATGKLTSDIVFNAILEGGTKIEEAFGETVPRATDSTRFAFDRLKLKIGEFIATSETVRTTGNQIASVLNFVADNLDALASASIVAAAALGGALAGQAMGRFVTEVQSVSRGASVAARSMATLRVAMAFLGGSWAVVVGGIAAAFAAFALSSDDTARAVGRVEQSFEAYNRASNAIQRDTYELARLNRELQKAIEDQEPAIERTKRADIDALNQRIAKHKELQEILLAQAAQDIPAVRRELEKLYREFAGNEGRGQKLFVNDETGGIEAFDRLNPNQQRAGFKNYEKEIELIKRRALAGEELNKADQSRLDLWVNKILPLREQIADFEERLRVLNPSVSDQASAAVTDFVNALGSGLGDATGALDKLIALLPQQQSAGERLRKLGSDIIEEYNKAKTNSGGGGGSVSIETIENQAANQARLRQELEQAFQLDLARAGANRDRLEQLQFELDVQERQNDLIEAGVSLEAAKTQALREQTELRAAAAEVLAQENAQIIAESQRAYELELARASGDLERVRQLERQESIQARINELVAAGVELEEAQRIASAREGLIDDASDAAAVREKYRDLFKEGFKAALDEDLGDFFADFLKRRAAQGLEDALSKLADSLSNWIFQSNGQGGSQGGIWDVISPIQDGANFLFGGGRASGGPTQAGKLYEVGEKGLEGFQMGGRNFILPPAPGYVTPNHQMGGQSTNVYQTVNFGADVLIDRRGRGQVARDLAAATQAGIRVS